MSLRNWVTFAANLLSLLVLGLVYVVGLTLQTLYATAKRAVSALRDSDRGDDAANGTPADSRTE